MVLYFFLKVENLWESPIKIYNINYEKTKENIFMNF